MPQFGEVTHRRLMQGRCNREVRGRLDRRRLGLALLGSALLGLWSGGVMAWGAKAYYPTSVSPVMPDEAKAQQVAVRPPAVFRTLSNAHQTAMDRGWKGIGPVFGASNETVLE